jgi:hypothetical protein
VRSGDLVVLLTSETGQLRQGRNVFVLEFRSAATRALVDVGDVRLAAAMTMPGMVMSGGAEIQRTDVSGRYQATAEFGMAGAWRISLEWTGAAGVGPGSASFSGDVR